MCNYCLQHNESSSFQWLLEKEAESKKFIPPCRDLQNLFVLVFGNCRCQLNFAVVFQVNDSKYKNLLPAPVFANSPN